MVEFCAEKGLCVGNVYFKYRSFNKYTRVARGQDGVDLNLLDLMLMKKDIL